MKKVLFSVAAVALFAATSCKKDYTCECTTTVTGLDPVTTSVEYEGVTKTEAEDACEAANVSVAGSSVSCELK